jgi:4-hydroxy-3-methylbut-2-en-1-yl diphosphate reductase
VSPVQICVSESAGFCWGVERALRLAREAAASAPGPIHTLGPLIHNPSVIASLAEQGIEVVDAPAAKKEGTIIIRSHGVPLETMAELAGQDLTVIDATCTFVKAAQEKAARLREEGYFVVVLGEPAHPEVLGIRSYAGPDSLVVQGPADLPPELPSRRVGVVVQTTQSQERLTSLVAALAPRVRELRLYNTICHATEERQQAAVAMASTVDLVVVVGGRNSGNTSRLAELCSAVQPRTHHIEEAEEILPEWLSGVRTVGVTAGASTPPEQIEAVVGRLEEMVP